MTRTPHKHAELIKAWADGAEIEIKCIDGSWGFRPNPWWSTDEEYRIKPEPKSDYSHTKIILRRNQSGEIVTSEFGGYEEDSVKITYSGETGEPIKVEICK